MDYDVADFDFRQMVKEIDNHIIVFSDILNKNEEIKIGILIIDLGKEQLERTKKRFNEFYNPKGYLIEIIDSSMFNPNALFKIKKVI